MSVVAMKEQNRKSGYYLIVERLYTAPSGWMLGARRGGPLHLADEKSWEIFTIDPDGIPCGRPAGFVDEDLLARAVARLADLTEAVA